MAVTRQAVTRIQESRRFKSMYTMHGKIESTRHVRFPRQSTYARCTLPAGSPRTWQSFTLTPQSWTDSTAPEKKGSPTTSLVCQLADLRVPTQFLSPHNHWNSKLKPNIYWGHAILVYWAHKHQHAIGTFNTCSWVPTPRSLTNTDEGYNLRGANFPYQTP
jgi:hypothetical protein